MTEQQVAEDLFAALAAANARRREAMRQAESEYEREAAVARRTYYARLQELRGEAEKSEAQA